MPRPLPSSRKQFDTYRAESRGPSTHPRDHHRRDRSTWSLVSSFYQLLRGQRAPLTLALATLTVATLLALLPPAATQFVIDYVLGGKPLPATVPAWVPRAPWPLLVTITIAVLAISLVKMLIHMWGRWHATRVTKLLQLSLRKQVF